MNFYHNLTAVCLLAVCGCTNGQSPSVAEPSPSGVIEVTADFTEVEGIKTVSTRTGPHRAIESVLFTVVSPEQIQGRQILISADRPHALPVTRDSSIRFRMNADRVPQNDTEKNMSVTIRDIELVSRENNVQ